MIGCLVAKQYAMIYQILIFPTTSEMVLKLFVDVLVFLYVAKGIYTMSKANTFLWRRCCLNCRWPSTL